MPRRRVSRDMPENMSPGGADAGEEKALDAPSAPSRRVLYGGDYHHRTRGTLVTVVDVEVRDGRATGRIVAVEKSTVVGLPFVCHEEDLAEVAPSKATPPRQATPSAAVRPRRGRRNP